MKIEFQYLNNGLSKGMTSFIYSLYLWFHINSSQTHCICIYKSIISLVHSSHISLDQVMSYVKTVHSFRQE